MKDIFLDGERVKELEARRRGSDAGKERGGFLDTVEGRVFYGDVQKGHYGPHNITAEGHLVDCQPGCPLYQSVGVADPQGDFGGLNG